jgi:Ca2+-transporting ATPase
LRDGIEIKIPAKELVPGDVIILHTGDRVPADARLLEAINLQVEEAALTGESVPVEKHVHALNDEDLPMVVATGMQTEFGKIAQLLQTIETGKTPLQQNLDKVGTVLARCVCGGCADRRSRLSTRTTIH